VNQGEREVEMAWGRLYKREKNWYTDIIFQGQRKREKIGTVKDVAQKILNKKLSDLTLEEHGIIEDEKVTLKEFSKEYLIDKKNSTQFNTYVGIELRVNLHLVSYFGKEFLFNITPHKVFSYQTKRLSEGLCNATVNREMTCLSNLLNTAVTWKRIKSNPIMKIKRLKEPPGRVRYLSLEEINRLLENCPEPPHPLRSIITVALTTGMRKSEIFGLKWEYIKPETRFIIIPITKNNTSRLIPANDTLLRTLADLPHNSDFVFLGRKGKPFVDLKISFKEACRKAGIKEFRFHDLRHTYASHLAMRGVHMRALQELLGHKNILMTQRYSHLSPEHLQGAVKLLDDIIPPAARLLKEGKPEELDTILTPDSEFEKIGTANNLKSLEMV
jgi:integrase